MTVIAGGTPAAPSQQGSNKPGSDKQSTSTQGSSKQRSHEQSVNGAPAGAAAPRSASAAPAPFISRDPEVRLEALFDPGSVRLLTPHDSSGEVAAVGTIDGMTAVAFASDPRVQGGAMGSEGCAAIVAAYDEALAQGAPVIGLWHSGGARLREGVESLHAVGTVFAAMTRASGKIPQLSVVLGPAAGGAAYGPALTDIVILGPEGRIFVTGPDVVRSVTGEDVDMARLGGPEPHSRRSGVVHLVAATDADALGQARRVALLPESPRRAYDVHPLIAGLLDDAGIELHPRWAPNVVTALGRFGGRTVGVVANNPLRLGGCLDSLSAEKASRFVRMCDAFGIPLVVVVDVPGYLPGVGQEWDGVVRRGAKLLHAFAEATVPRVTLVTRKSYGGAYIAMNSRALGATRVLAWPGAEIAVMGGSAAVQILHGRSLRALPGDERLPTEQGLVAEYETAFSNPYRAAERGYVDAVIQPRDTRKKLIHSLEMLETKRDKNPQKKHGNMPL